MGWVPFTKNGSQARAGGVGAGGLHAAREIALLGPGVELGLVAGWRHVVAGYPIADLIGDKQRQVGVVGVEGDERRPTPSGGFCVESGLIVAGRVGQAVVVPQGRSGVGYPDRGKAWIIPRPI